MHPEVVQVGQGICPLCGMALEPKTASREPEDQSELRDMRRRFWVSLVFSLPLFIIAMSDMIPGGVVSRAIPQSILPWLELVLAAPVVFWAGWPLLVRGALSLKHRHLNMFTLIALGVSAAFGFSVFVTLFPHAIPHGTGQGHALPLYFESAAVITSLVLLGQVLELRARQASSSAVRALLDLAPKTARRIEADGTENEIAIELLHVGDRLRIRPGEKIPTDGVILEGTTTIDESMVTGESGPVQKRVADPVTGGTLNGTGSFLMLVKRTGEDSLLAQIIRMVSEAQRSRAPIQRVADRLSAVFVPTVVGVAILTAFAWGLLGPEPRLGHAFVNALAVLIIACPCALGLATPISILVGTGRGATEGILIRNAEALEAFERVDTLVVDKTGTLTEGRPRLVSVEPFGVEADTVLRVAASLEVGSEHPLAAAVTAGAKTKNIHFEAARDFMSVTGKGITGTVDGKLAAIGNAELLLELGLDVSATPGEADTQAKTAELRDRGETVLWIAFDGRLIGLLGVADPIKASSAPTLAALKRDGLRVVMLTGDHLRTARVVARDLGIEEVHASVLPDQKGEYVAQLQAAGAIVAMAGDGVNDAPALARADVGIAMGTGTDVAIQSASVTLVKGDLRGILKARRLSRAVMRNIRQNLFFAFAYNLVGVPVAAGLLYPVFGLLLSPMLASAAMSASSVSVIANALRLRNARLWTSSKLQGPILP
jgi:Cu+-exporting ATPase